MSVLSVTCNSGSPKPAAESLMQCSIGWKLLLTQILLSQACVELETKNITLEVLYHISIHQLVRASRIDFWSWRNRKKGNSLYPTENFSSFNCHGGKAYIAIPGHERIQKRFLAFSFCFAISHLYFNASSISVYQWDIIIGRKAKSQSYIHSSSDTFWIDEKSSSMLTTITLEKNQINTIKR